MHTEGVRRGLKHTPDAKKLIDWQSTLIDFDKVPEYVASPNYKGRFPFGKTHLDIIPMKLNPDEYGISCVTPDGGRLLALEPGKSTPEVITHEIGHAATLNWVDAVSSADRPRAPKSFQPALDTQMPKD